MAFPAFGNFMAARFDLSRSGLAATTGATTPMTLGPGRARVHVAAHQSEYRASSPALSVSARASGWGRPRYQPRPQAGPPSMRPMADSSAAELLAQLNRAYARRPILTVVLGILFGIALVKGIALGSGWGATLVFGAASAIVLWCVHLRVDQYYSEPVEYVLDHNAAQAYRKLLKAFRRLAAGGPIWYIDARHRTVDGRRAVRRRLVVPTLALPPRVQSNLRVPKLACGRHTLYFFPDRLLVYEAQVVWGIFYDELQVKAGDIREVADYTGADDETALNGFIALGSAAGLAEVFRCDDPAAAAEVAAALRELG
jgi:hypothetical protein